MATHTFFDSFLQAQYEGGTAQTISSMPVDFDGDTIKFGIITSTVTPDTDETSTHLHWDDLSGNEVSGTNYTAGGITVTSITVTREGSGIIMIDGVNITILQDAGGFSNGRHGILYKSTGTASTSPLISAVDFGADKGNVSNDLLLSFNANGIYRFTKA